MKKPKEDRTLSITMDYTRDPRYFGKSFRRVLNVIPEIEDHSEGAKIVKMSKEEIMEVKRTQIIFSCDSVNHIFYLIEDVFSDKNLYFKKELYVKGGAFLGEHNTVRAIACDGDIYLGSKSGVIRWIDSSGSIETGYSSNLGISCSSEHTLKISKNCTFSFSEGSVKVEEGVVILGNIFSQDIVHIEKGVRVGADGILKSVIGKKGVIVSENVGIYGYVLA